MTLLNRTSDGLLSVFLVLRRALLAYGPLAREDLLDLCGPAGAIERGGPISSTLLWMTLRRWEQLGAFAETSGKLRVSGGLEAVAMDDVEGIRDRLLDLILRPENSGPISADQNDTDATRAADLTRALAWALAQDPYQLISLAGGGDLVSFARDQAVQPDIFANETRWPAFQEWAHFLGLAIPGLGKALIIIAPTRAIRSRLRKASTAPVPIMDFLRELAERLPIFDGGSYRLALEGQVGRPWRSTAPNEISPTLSLALLQLRHEGALRMVNLADASIRMTLLGRGGRALESVTHVVIEGTR
jgi:hypothetical protein